MKREPLTEFYVERRTLEPATGWTSADMLTPGEAGRVLGVSTSTISRRMNAGKLTVYIKRLRPGRGRRYVSKIQVYALLNLKLVKRQEQNKTST